jgi:adenine-specific DNA methylase
MSLENDFDATFATELALKEKQIQQSYRPIIGLHKWFARRPGTLFRCLLLAEFNGAEPLETSYWRSHRFGGVIADPFMGGGTPIYEANRLGFSVVGTDINPIAFWIVRQALVPLDSGELGRIADEVASDIQSEVGHLYRTKCVKCGGSADVKYFLWVKTATCPSCETVNDLFPGYLLAENDRHPKNVLACSKCGELNEYETVPTREAPQSCRACDHAVHVEGNARRQRVQCRSCTSEFSYLPKDGQGPPEHRMWALEYHCAHCKPEHEGRFFKRPDASDLSKVNEAIERLSRSRRLPIPDDAIPPGDETDRLHRWGYGRYREMFGARQLLGLGLLLRRILRVKQAEYRHALLTIFSDSLRYQNMLCRYDTYALKCQDIFSVHGFPVGLVQCENNLIGVPRVGSGAFRHFVEKYIRAKEYCRAPFETRNGTGPKKAVFVRGESIEARLTKAFPRNTQREAYLRTADATSTKLAPGSLDGVFTDPPYFDNVQYAELMDFCHVWLRLGLGREFKEFRRRTTRSASELTGNVTLGRGIEHFTDGLSAVFRHYAGALKPHAPFVFTYHHNDASAYVPLVVAILDSGLHCTATLPAAAEMSASLHISGTGSSVLDSVFVCRRAPSRGTRSAVAHAAEVVFEALANDAGRMREAGLVLRRGDLRCLAAGHVARVAINRLASRWNPSASLEDRMARATAALAAITDRKSVDLAIDKLLEAKQPRRPTRRHQAAWLPGF